MSRTLPIDWESIRIMKKVTAPRRLIWPEDNMHILTIPVWPIDNARGRVLKWIETNTTGMFYLGGDKVAFKDEKDELMFKLGFKI